MLLVVLTTMFCSCFAANNSKEIYNSSEITTVLQNYYPQLYEYCEEGVMIIKSLKEVTFDDGSFGYKIKYVFVKRYIEDNEKLEVVKNTYPELYKMYTDGVIDITSVYKYVDKNTGKINVKVVHKPIYRPRHRRFRSRI